MGRRQQLSIPALAAVSKRPYFVLVHPSIYVFKTVVMFTFLGAIICSKMQYLTCKAGKSANDNRLNIQHPEITNVI